MSNPICLSEHLLLESQIQKSLENIHQLQVNIVYISMVSRTDSLQKIIQIYMEAIFGTK